MLCRSLSVATCIFVFRSSVVLNCVIAHEEVLCLMQYTRYICGVTETDIFKHFSA